MYLLIDENNIVRCMASDECNLHKDKLHMTLIKTDCAGTVGDEYDSEKKTWKPKPENYPVDTEAKKEKKIQDELRKMAIERLELAGDNDFKQEDSK